MMNSPRSPNSPRSATTSRRSYHRLSSSQDFNDLIDECFDPERPAQGLGISGERRVSIPRVPVGSRTSMHSRKNSNPFSTGQNSPQIADSPFITEPSKPLLSSPGLTYNGEVLRKLAAVEEQEQEPYNMKGKNKSSSFTEDFDGEDIEERSANNGNYNDNSTTASLFEECAANSRQNSKAALRNEVSTRPEQVGSRSRSCSFPYTRPFSPRYG